MFKLVITTVIVALATPAVAQIQPDVQFALHNGSVMAVLSDGAIAEFGDEGIRRQRLELAI